MMGWFCAMYCFSWDTLVTSMGCTDREGITGCASTNIIACLLHFAIFENNALQFLQEYNPYCSQNVTSQKWYINKHIKNVFLWVTHDAIQDDFLLILKLNVP